MAPGGAGVAEEELSETGIKQRRLVPGCFQPRDVGLRMNAIAASRESASLSSGGDAEGKRSSSSLRAISSASLAIWLWSLPGLSWPSVSFQASWLVFSSLAYSLQCREQLPVLPELLVHLRSLLQEFENDCLVLHGGLLRLSVVWSSGSGGIVWVGRGKERVGASRAVSSAIRQGTIIQPGSGFGLAPARGCIVLLLHWVTGCCRCMELILTCPGRVRIG